MQDLKLFKHKIVECDYFEVEYVNREAFKFTFYTLQPGKSNYPYHQHTGTEEVFYIISGTATLKTPKGDVIVSGGDVIVMPPNENGAHMLTNHSAEPLVYLDVHTLSSPEVIIYPDSGNVRILAGNMQKSYKIESEVNYLDGE